MARVLVVDDDPEIRNLITTILRNNGHEPVAAADVGEAWGLLASNIALAMVDIDMPGETGVELVLRMRDHEPVAGIPVIFVTAYRERAHPLISSGAGRVDIVDKPFRMEVITARIAAMLEAK